MEDKKDKIDCDCQNGCTNKECNCCICCRCPKCEEVRDGRN